VVVRIAVTVHRTSPKELTYLPVVKMRFVVGAWAGVWLEIRSVWW
jgi:hypothetical protein